MYMVKLKVTDHGEVFVTIRVRVSYSSKVCVRFTISSASLALKFHVRSSNHVLKKNVGETIPYPVVSRPAGTRTHSRTLEARQQSRTFERGS